VVITTDWGQQYKSNVLTIANTNATISASNYVSLSWTQVPGTVLASVYRKTGATYVRVADISNGATSAFDNGSMAAPESGFPSITLTKAKAYTEIKPQTFLTAFEGQTWPAFSISIVVPSTYNMGLTTGKQWLVTGPTVALGSQRQLYIDRIGLGFQAGGWAESTVEKPAGNVSTTMTSSDQGTGGSQNTYNPPPGYGGYDGGIYHPSTL
jgi:hypothetical protein